MKHSTLHTSITKESLERLNNVLSENSSALNEYGDTLLWWNTKINLVSREVSRETIQEHIKHSLLLYDYINLEETGRVIDTGTGGGLPGIPLAICLPDIEFVLNDIVAKKMMAVKQMIGALHLGNVRTESMSVEKINVNDRDVVITKHAFKINELINLLKGKGWRRLVFLKGEKETLNELEGVEESLLVRITNLDKVIKSDFYKGKGIVEVEKNNE